MKLINELHCSLAEFLIVDKRRLEGIVKLLLGLLMIRSINLKKIAIPIFWLLLNHKGNSSTKERIALIQRFIDVFGRDNILGVLGDREFIGRDWFTYLKNRELAFYIRIKKDADTTNKYGKRISVQWLFHHLPFHQPYVVQKQRKIYGTCYILQVCD